MKPQAVYLMLALLTFCTSTKVFSEPYGGNETVVPIYSTEQLGSPHFQNQHLRAWATLVNVNSVDDSMSIGVLVENYSNEPLRIAQKGIGGHSSFRSGNNAGGVCDPVSFRGAAIVHADAYLDPGESLVWEFVPSNMTIIPPKSTISLSFLSECRPQSNGDIASLLADFIAEIRGKRQDFTLGISGMKITRIQDKKNE